jgi:hypothetical protein
MFLDCPGSPSVIITVLVSGRRQEKENLRRTQPNMAGYEDKGREHKPKNAGEAGKCKKRDPPKSPEGTQPCPYLKAQ